MKTPLTLLTTFALALAARADMTITQKMEQSGAPEGATAIPPTTLVMKFKGDQMRVDGMPQMSTIVDLKSGEVTSLIHPQKAYMSLPAAMVKAMQGARKPEVPKAEVPKATGRKETISGFPCEEYETTMGEAKMHFWLTKDLPAVEKLMAEMSALTGDANPLGDVMKANNITGFPMKTVLTVPAMGTMTMTVVSLNQDPIADSEFALPKDYKKLEMPAVPAQ